MVNINKRNRATPQMRTSKDPDYYYNKRMRLLKRMAENPPPVVPVPAVLRTNTLVPAPAPTPVVKNKPGRKKKVQPIKNPIKWEQKDVMVRWD